MPGPRKQVSQICKKQETQSYHAYENALYMLALSRGLDDYDLSGDDDDGLRPWAVVAVGGKERRGLSQRQLGPNFGSSQSPTQNSGIFSPHKGQEHPSKSIEYM